jgi:hypothetical protein
MLQTRFCLVHAKPVMGWHVGMRFPSNSQLHPRLIASQRQNIWKVHTTRSGHTITAAAASEPVLDESEIHGMSAFLDSLKWDNNGLVVAIAQHIDTGEVLMQAFADRNAVSETLQTGYVEFYFQNLA